jgi:uncharacterized protein
VIETCCAAETSTGDLAQLFVFGLVMSAGHCLGMCGPLVCAASLPASDRNAHPWSSSVSAVTYHAGRLSSYALLGIALGTISIFVPSAANTIVWQALLSFLAAAALFWIGLGLLGVFRVASVPYVGSLSRWLFKGLNGAKGPRGLVQRFGLGMANGFLPCGPVYTVAFAALAAGGPWRGAVAMVTFGAGTVPLLVALAFGVRWSSLRWRSNMHRISAAVALLMASQLALRGMAALEWVPHAHMRELVLW